MKTATFPARQGAMERIERHPMDKQNQLLILLSGILGLMLAVLTSRSRSAIDSMIAVIGGLFGALVVAPAFAEALTNLSTIFAGFRWLNAAPNTALFAAIIGLGGLVGGQIVIAFKSDFVAWVKGFARRRLGIKNGRSRQHESEG